MKFLDLFRKKKVIKTGNPVIDFYNRYDEDSRLMKRSRMPEYLITMRYIEKYLKPDSKILEIGAGTGRYSIALAEKGYDVTRLHFVGVDMLSYLFDDRLDNLNDREFEEYMKFLSNLCEREDCVGLSIHMLDIFRKE